MAALAFAACSQIEPTVPGDYPLPPAGTSEETTVTVTAPEGFSFAPDDCISVFAMNEPDSNRVFRLSSVDGQVAKFVGTAMKASTYCVIYPYSDSNAVTGTDNDGEQCSIVTSVPALEDPAVDGNVYVALSDSLHLTLYPTCAKLDVPLYKPSTEATKAVSVSVVGLGGESLSGPMSVVMHKGAAPVFVKAVGNNNPKTVVKDLEIDENTKHVSMTVAPQTLASGYKIEVTLEDGVSKASTEINEAITIGGSGVAQLKPFVYEPKFYVDFVCDARPDFGSYKLDFDEATMTGRVWFFSNSVPDALFKGRVHVLKVTIPSFITALGNESFRAMTNLTEITFEEGSQCTTFGPNCLREDTKLKTITVPKSVTILGNACMQGCRGLESIVFEAGSQCETFDNNCLYNAYALKAIEIPASVKRLGNSCLKTDGTTVLKSLTFAEGSVLESMEGTCIEGHNLIGTIRLPESIKTIANPNGTTKSLNPKLTIYCPCKVPPTFTGKWTNGVAQVQAIYVPKGTVALYESTLEPSGAAGSGWARYKGKFKEM